jgi:hypothetical protein
LYLIGEDDYSDESDNLNARKKKIQRSDFNRTKEKNSSEDDSYRKLLKRKITNKKEKKYLTLLTRLCSSNPNFKWIIPNN